jgi:hypothetical protein
MTFKKKTPTNELLIIIVVHDWLGTNNYLPCKKYEWNFQAHEFHYLI